MNIRCGQIQDIDKMKHLLNEHIDEHPDPYGVTEWSLYSLQKMGAFSFVLETDDGEIVGEVSGMESRPWFNHEIVSVVVFSFYVRKEYRRYSLRLWKAFVEHCKNHKVVFIKIGLQVGEEQETLDKLYRHLGFQPTEVHYERRL